MSKQCGSGCLCNCCSGVQPSTRRSVANAHGRSQLRYRVGQYGDFLQSMIAELGTMRIALPDMSSSQALLGGALPGQVTPLASLPENPLIALTTRSHSDPTIAMLDAWSIVLHVMSFYSERIANEGYLRTATEFRSVLELARLVGYQPRPGVSATTHLAYLLEKDHALTIRAGSKAQSVPESEQLPQTFETQANLKANYQWNNLIPRRARPQVFEPGQTTADKRVFFEGLNTQLKPNDVLLIVFDRSQGEPFRVKKVVQDNPVQRTLITLQDFSTSHLLGNAADAQTEALRQINAAFLALQLSDVYAELEETIGPSMTQLVGTLKAKTATPSTSATAETLGALVNALELAVSDRIFVEPKDRSPFDDFFNRLGMTAEYLRIQVAAISASQIDLAFEIESNSKVSQELKDGIASLKRDFSSVSSMSAITLACVLDRCEKTLELLPIADLTDDQRLKVQVANHRARELLGVLVRSLLRVIIDRFLNVRQAGIPTDCRLALFVQAALEQFRNSFVPIATPAAKIKATLNQSQNSLEKYIGQTQVFKLLKGLVKKVEAANDVEAKAVADRFIERISALAKFSASLASVPASEQEFTDLTDLAKKAGVRFVLFPLVNGQKLAYTTCWLDFCFDKAKLDDALKDTGVLGKSIELAKKLGDDPSGARDDFIKQCTQLATDQAGVEDGFDLVVDSDNDESVINVDARQQKKLLSDTLELINKDIEAFNDGLNLESLRFADATQSRFVAMRRLIDETTTEVDKLTISGSKYPDEAVKKLKQQIDNDVGKLNSIAPEFLRLTGALEGFSKTLATEPQETKAITVHKKMWRQVMPTALSILKNAEPILGAALTELVAKVPVNGLQSVMPRLRQAARIAEAGVYPRVAPWLKELVEALDQFASDLTLKADADTVKTLKSPPIDLDAISREPEMSSIEMSRFSQSLKPASSALSKEEQVSSGTINELAIQLAGEFNPRLSGMVYSAIENAKPLRRRRFQDIHVLRAKAGPFGRTAQPMIESKDGRVNIIGEWPLKVPPPPPATATDVFSPQHQPNVILLDAIYDKVTPGSFVIIERTVEKEVGIESPLVARVDAVATVTAQGYGLGSTSVTQLTLDRPWIAADGIDTLNRIRNVVVYLQSEPLELAGEPYDADIGPLTSKDLEHARIIELDEVIPGLESGQWIVVAGERTDVPGTTGIVGSELALIDDVQQIGDVPNTSGQGRSHTVLLLAQTLTYSYQRSTVSIYANVVKADHGETKVEVIGSGDARVPGQTFELKQKPLTHLSSPTASGAESTLKVRVNGVLWHPAERGAELGPNDRQFETQIDADDKVAVRFSGARLPTGKDNVRAEFRVGTGTGGNLPAGKITQLLSRPLGVKEVLNPVDSVGGTDRESTDHARRNAPLGVTALDRLVSVSDYADFARAYAGVEKSFATRITDGKVQRVHVTVAGQNGEELPTNSDLFQNLHLAMRKSGDPLLPLTLANRQLQLIVFVARITVHADFEFEAVRAAARKRVLQKFGFEQREFGQDVVLSELVATIQDTQGIVGVMVDGFGTIKERDANGSLNSLEMIVDQLKVIADATQPIVQRIPISRTRRIGDTIHAAEIAFFSQRLQQTLILNEDPS